MTKIFLITSIVLLNTNVFADSTNHFHGNKSHSHPFPSTGVAHMHNGIPFIGKYINKEKNKKTKKYE